jgi:hypothetical protein
MCARMSGHRCFIGNAPEGHCSKMAAELLLLRPGHSSVCSLQASIEAWHTLRSNGHISAAGTHGDDIRGCAQGPVPWHDQ